MTNFDNYAMKPKMPLGTTPIPTTQTVMPPSQPAPTQSYGGGLLGNLFGNLGGMGNQQANPLGFIGGLLGSLFAPKQTTPASNPERQIIDKRPDDIQALVSMFANKE